MERTLAPLFARSVEIELKGLRFIGAAMLAASIAAPNALTQGRVWCPLRAATGVPCPLCGMTTSVVAAMHGHLMTALSVNPFGIVAVLGAVILLMVKPKAKLQTLSIRVDVAVTLIMLSWIFQLFRYY